MTASILKLAFFWIFYMLGSYWEELKSQVMCHSHLFLMLLYIHESSPIQIQYLNNINNIYAGQSGKGGLDFEKHKLTFF